MLYQMLADDGAPLDAHFEIEGNTIIFHSRGGTKGKNARNVDYSRGLRLLLQRLAAAGHPVKRAWVDSSRVQAIPLSDRMVLDEEDAAASPVEQVSRMQAVGRQPATDHGNSTKRIRLQLAVDVLKGGIAPALKSRTVKKDFRSEQRLRTSELERVTTDVAEVTLRELKQRVSAQAPGAVPQGIPDGIRREHVLAAIRDLDASISNDFGDSTGYDLVFEGKRYPPKAVIGLAARHAAHVQLGPYDFKGGERSKAFRILHDLGFVIETKMRGVARGSPDWSEDEVRALVADYFSMLEDELAGRPYNKAEHRRVLLSKLNGRTEASIEFKHQNVSAVLLELNFPYLQGYKSASNYQSLLMTIVQEHIGTETESISEIERLCADTPVPAGFSEATFAQARADVPVLVGTEKGREPARRRQARRYDFRAKDEANRQLGRAGEAFVMAYERWRLRNAGRPDLADNIVWLSDETGDGAGYDIESFEADGSKIYIEVKTTRQGDLFPFLLSANELDASIELGDAYRLYRVFSFGSSSRLYIIRGSLTTAFSLRPTTFEARLQSVGPNENDT